MTSRRRKQVADLIRDEVSEILASEMKDPRLGMVSITRGEMSPDLRYATLLTSVYGDESEQQETMQALSGASGYIRRLLAPRMRIRHIPSIRFTLDHSMEHAEQITRTLHEVLPEQDDSNIQPVESDPDKSDQS
jgi:ribosome-binding factor A